MLIIMIKLWTKLLILNYSQWLKEGFNYIYIIAVI